MANHASRASVPQPAGPWDADDSVTGFPSTYVLAEQNGEWTEGRSYMGIEILAACKKIGSTHESNGTGVTIEAIGA